MTYPTDPFLTDQLIPYIGNKRKLLPLIWEAVQATGLRDGVFFDVFSGSGVVSRLAKVMGFQVISNDWEPYSRVINSTYIGANRSPAFSKLGGLDSAIKSLNSIKSVRGYIARHYCPADDENYNIERERMFYTQENGRRIDAMREQIELWRSDGAIDSSEESVLLAPLVYQAAYCSNTSGVFKGFHNGWGGATKTAWYRIRSYLTLKPPVFWDNDRENIVISGDATKIASEIECDIAYLDPPYNQHQYGSNYHLLNTVALWDKPHLNEFISKSERDKAAIRKDWIIRKSAYCSKATALAEFSGLINNLRARYILVSYSTDGIMPVEDLLKVLADRGSLKVIPRRYKRYRVSSQRPSPRPHTVEFVAVVDTNSSATGKIEKELKAVLSYEF